MELTEKLEDSVAGLVDEANASEEVKTAVELDASIDDAAVGMEFDAPKELRAIVELKTATVVLENKKFTDAVEDAAILDELCTMEIDSDPMDWSAKLTCTDE
jgi:hypothetical protein